MICDRLQLEEFNGLVYIRTDEIICYRYYL